MAASVSRLKGRAEAGMFPTEVAFVVIDHAGQKYVVMVPKEMIGEADGAATILVRVIDRSDDLALVSVPGEPLGPDTLSVRNSELLPA